MIILSEKDIKAIAKQIAIELKKEDNQAKTYNVDQLVDMLKVERQKIYKLFNEKQLAHIKIGKKYFVLHNDLGEFLNKNKQTSKTQ
jgi:hypothetical protein